MNLEKVFDSPVMSDIGQISPTSWKAPQGMTFEQWEAIGQSLQTIQGSINWWVGDWLNEGESRYGETYAQAIEVTGWDYARLSMAKRVSELVPLSTRVESLSWTMHREVSKLPPHEQEHWLNRAASQGWSSRKLREAIDNEKHKSYVSNGGELEYRGREGEDGDSSEYLAPLWSAEGGSGELPYDEYEYAPSWEPEEGERKPHVSNNSGNNEWYTPPVYIEAARKTMGGIDTDPASSDIANQTVNSSTYFTKEDDGLTQSWFGNVWMNPPYSQPEIQQFCQKLNKEFLAGNVSNAVVLVNNATETAWFRLLAEVAAAICFPSGRIRFLDMGGNPSGAPLQGQAILYLGKSREQFKRNFEPFGLVVYATGTNTKQG